MARQFDASVRFLQQLLRNGLRSTNLRDAVSVVSDLGKRAPDSGSNGNLWRHTQVTVKDITREIDNKKNSGGNNEENNPPRGAKEYELEISWR